MPYRIQSGEMFDLSIGSFNNPFGYEKIIYMGCEGFSAGLGKYIDELEKMSNPKIAKQNPKKEQKRRKRLEFLELCDENDDLRFLFTKLMQYINGIQNSVDEFDNNPVVVTVAGGNIYTIFAGLILGIHKNEKSVVDFASWLVSVRRHPTISKKLVGLCNYIVKTGFSDLDFNLLPSKTTAESHYLDENDCDYLEDEDEDDGEYDEEYDGEYDGEYDDDDDGEFYEKGEDFSKYQEEEEEEEEDAFSKYRDKYDSSDSDSFVSDRSSSSSEDEMHGDSKGFVLFRIKTAQELYWDYSAHIRDVDGCHYLADTFGEEYRPGAPDKLEIINKNIKQLKKGRHNSHIKQQIKRCETYLKEMKLQRDANDQLTKHNAKKLVELLSRNDGGSTSKYVLLARYLNQVSNWMNQYIRLDSDAYQINPLAFQSVETIVSDTKLIELAAKITSAYANDPTMLIESWTDYLNEEHDENVNVPASVFMPRSAPGLAPAKRILQTNRFGELPFPDGIRISLNSVITDGPSTNISDNDDIDELAKDLKRLRLRHSGRGHHGKGVYLSKIQTRKLKRRKRRKQHKRHKTRNKHYKTRNKRHKQRKRTRKT